MVITFEELRKIKDSLPPGSMDKIAEELSLNANTVRNYFGGTHYERGAAMGIYLEKGVNGTLVKIENMEILDCALRLLNKHQKQEIAK